MVLNKKQALRLSAACIAVGLLAAPGAAMAQKTAPLSFQASPDVYKVIADGEHYRIIQATWQPGQRDAWHSHPEKGTYFGRPARYASSSRMVPIATSTTSPRVPRAYGRRSRRTRPRTSGRRFARCFCSSRS